MEQQIQQVSQSVSGFTRSITSISRIMAAVGAIIFGIMMLVTLIDVGGRYFFLHPLNGAAELEGLLLVLAGTWGMGYCQLLSMNIRIDILANKFPQKVQTFLWLTGYLLACAIAVFVAVQAFARTGQYINLRLEKVSDTLSIPYWPFMLAMGIGFAWAGFILFVDLIKLIRKIAKR